MRLTFKSCTGALEQRIASAPTVRNKIAQGRAVLRSAPPWVDGPFLEKALQGRNKTSSCALAWLCHDGVDESQGGAARSTAALCPGLVCCARSVQRKTRNLNS